MKVALVGDVHANLPALEAVLEHASRRGAKAVWNTGDFVGYGPFPDEVVRMLRQGGAISIVGNYDTKVLRLPARDTRRNPVKTLAFRWAYENLSQQSRDYLRTLPQQMRLEAEGKRVLLVHGSPESPDEHLTGQTPEARLRELAKRAEADIVVCGHSHQPFVRRVDGTWFINTGSVGRPDDGNWRACYALMEVTPNKVRVRHWRVDYDLQRTVEGMQERHLPEAFVRMIVLGRALDEVDPKRQSKGDGKTKRQPRRADPTPAMPPPHDEPPAANTREASLEGVMRLARACDYEQGHTHQVTRLALRLFDDLEPLHGLGDQERFYLQCASLLHDIGWIEGQAGHHKTALRIILESPLLPFNGHQREVIGCIARYHRKAEPKKKHRPFGRMGSEDQDVVRTLSAMLRVADSLDVLHEDRVREITVEVDRDKVVLHCLASGPIDEEQGQARKKGGLFERVFGRKLSVQWHQA